MKIAVIGHSMMGKRNFNLFRHMDKNEISLIAPEKWKTLWGQDTKYEKEYNKNINVILTRVFFNGFVPFYLFLNLKRILAKIKPDIVLTFGEPYSFIAIQSQRICTKLNIPHLIFTWENLEYNYKSYLLTRVYVLKRCKGIIAGNKEAKMLCIKYGAKCPIKIIPQSGIDTNLFNDKAGNLRKKLNLERKKIILFAGRFVKEKGVYYLLRSIKDLKEKYKNIFLLLVGDGFESEKFRLFIKNNGLSDYVKILKWIDYNDMPKIYKTADVFVYPSYESRNWKEQFGFAILEAMTCGVPVIATKSGTIPEVVDNAAILVKERLSGELTEAIIKILKNKGMYDMFKKKGINHAKNYDIKRVAKEYLLFFEDIIKNERNGRKDLT